METVFKEAKEKMEASLEHFKREISRLRTGRASAAIFDEIKVDYYGGLTPLNKVATISIPEANMVIIQPWDKNVLPEVEKAIIRSNVGLNPINDGAVIKIPIPPLDEERRKDIVKLLHKILEEAKASIRNIRRETREKLKDMEEDKDISEDDKFKGFDRIQELHDKFIKKAEEIADKKEEEIMQV